MLSEEGISQYEILLTTGGFITSDPLVYISGYQYSYDGKNAVYGYKLQLNDDGSTFTVLEEGVEIGEFVCLNESSSAKVRSSSFLCRHRFSYTIRSEFLLTIDRMHLYEKSFLLNQIRFSPLQS